MRTGGHAIPLARRGHTVTGIDRAPDMLAQARKKTLEHFSENKAPTFVESDIRTVELLAKIRCRADDVHGSRLSVRK